MARADVPKTETVLRRLARDRHLLRHAEFSAAFAEQARALGLGVVTVSERQFWRWMTGRVVSRPYPRTCLILEKLFGHPVDVLLSAGENHQGHQPRTDTSSDDRVADHKALTSTETRPGIREVHPHERLLDLMRAAADESRQSIPGTEATVGAATMEYLERDVITHAHMYPMCSPLDIVPKIIQTRREIEQHLQRTRCPDQLGHLQFLAGVASVLLAEACNELGQHDQAVDHALAAWAYADAIGHISLAAHARGKQATSYYWSQRPHEAVNTIARAAEIRPSGMAAARLHSISARTWSYVGNIDRTITAVRAATDAREHAHGSDDLHDNIGGIFRWTAAREQRCHSTAYLQLIQVRRDEITPEALDRLTNEILAHTHRAMAAFQAAPPDQQSPALRATICLDMATAHLILGDASSAGEVLAPLFELPPDRRTHPVLYRLHGLRAELSTMTSSRPVRELTESLHVFATGSTLRALPSGS
ncbi:hypothetical protein HII36_22315 [Nonomuraea sp. NN258]|uniref:hypothetical protein n=1 Tax=Nonomuraea antri TaxID=2730852 RepID=UPI001567D63E|nr:hypothetical protein [Nonomuraea antri]NRQ34554.1 hypothetical protein [Nonomuraea antri]